MAEYIDRATIKERFEKRKQWLEKDVHDEYSGALLDGCNYDMDLLDEIPAADVAPTPKWISVEDGLPEENRMVAIYLQWRDELTPEKTEPPECRVAMRRYGVWKFCPRGYYKITHWMPLPEPPKEEDK